MKWNTELYNKQHDFVYRYGEAIVKLLHAKPYEKILDLGCGTGELTKTIEESGALVTGIDSSEQMIDKAKMNFPFIPFEVKDAANLDYTNEFDAVFSNAVLHWIMEKEEVAGCIYKALKPGGRLVAEFGGKNNIKSITDAIKNAFARRELCFTDCWYFPSIAEYAGLLEKKGFRVLLIQHIDRPTELSGEEGMRNWITMFGNNLFTGLPVATREEIINEAVEELRGGNYKEGKWYADYARLRVHAIRDTNSTF